VVTASGNVRNGTRPKTGIDRGHGRGRHRGPAGRL